MHQDMSRYSRADQSATFSHPNSFNNKI